MGTSDGYKNLLYMNFNVRTNKAVRVPIRERFQKMNVTMVRGVSIQQFWQDVVESKFVVSPPGKMQQHENENGPEHLFVSMHRKRP